MSLRPLIASSGTGESRAKESTLLGDLMSRSWRVRMHMAVTTPMVGRWAGPPVMSAQAAEV